MQFSIDPDLIEATGVFDDEATGLKEEAFVLGMSEMISAVIESKGIPNAAEGFVLTFSDEPFDGHDVELQWSRADEPETPMAGNWYSGEISGQVMEGWLCPALFCFFESAPQRLFVKADPLTEGVDPIWHVSPDDPRQRRIMSAGDGWDQPIPVQFDVDEFRMTYGQLDTDIDVFDIGYTNPDGQYEPPASEWRRDHRTGGSEHEQ